MVLTFELLMKEYIYPLTEPTRQPATIPAAH